MKKFILKYTLLTAILTVSAASANAQCDTIAAVCGENFSREFLSDGQEYRALLFDDQTSEFHLTLYGQSTYRFAACSGLTSGNMLFRVYDEERNEIFISSDHGNAPYWDFNVTSTLDVVIEGNLNLDKVQSGCAVLLVGFKP
jgi:hypothetical protein